MTNEPSSGHLHYTKISAQANVAEAHGSITAMKQVILFVLVGISPQP